MRIARRCTALLLPRPLHLRQAERRTRDRCNTLTAYAVCVTNVHSDLAIGRIAALLPVRGP